MEMVRMILAVTEEISQCLTTEVGKGLVDR